MHGTSHEGMVLSTVFTFFFTFISVKHLVVGELVVHLLRHVWLCCADLSVFLQQASRCRHVSFWWDSQRLQCGDMPCWRICFFAIVTLVATEPKFHGLCDLHIGDLWGIPK